MEHTLWSNTRQESLFLPIFLTDSDTKYFTILLRPYITGLYIDLIEGAALAYTAFVTYHDTHYQF